MIPIFILSIIAVYIFFERYLLIRKYAKNNNSFMDKLREYMFAHNTRSAISLCNEENTPMSRMLVKGILHYQLPVSELRSVIESNANLEVSGMEKGLSTLATWRRYGSHDWIFGNSSRYGTSLLRYGTGR